MAKWLNRTLVQAPRNGTTTHTVTFTAATAGNLLVLLLEAGVTHTVPTGWTRQAQALNNTELSVYTKTATAGESSFTTTHGTANFPMAAEVFEFAAGSTWVGGVSGSGLAFGAANPTLSGLTGTNLLFGVIGYGEWNGTTRATAWTGTPTPVEDSDVCAPAVGQGDGYEYSLAYVEDSTATSFAPTGAITPTTGTNTTKEALTFAVKVTVPAVITKVAETTATVAATAGATFNVTVPAGVGTTHMGVLVINTDSPGTTTATATGWTTRVANPTGQTNSEFSVLTRLGGLVAGNTIAVTLTTARNADVTAIWFDTAGQNVTTVGTAGTRSGTSQTGLTIPGLTTTVASQPVLVIASERTTATGTTIASWSPTTPTQQHFHEGTGAAASQYVGLLAPATAGTVPAETATYSGASGNAAGVMLALGSSVPSTSGAIGLTFTVTGTGSTVAQTTGSQTLNLAVTGQASTVAATTSNVGLNLNPTGPAQTVATTTGITGFTLNTGGEASTVALTTGTAGFALDLSGEAQTVAVTTAAILLGLTPTGETQTVAVTTTTTDLELTLTGVAETVATTTGEMGLRFTVTGSSTSYSGLPHDITVTGSLTPRRWAGTLPERTKTGALTDRRWDAHLA